MKELGRDPRNDHPSASGSSLADMTATLLDITFSGALLLAQSRRGGWAQPAALDQKKSH